MTDQALLLAGQPVADRFYAQLEDRINTLKSSGIEPGLALVRVGEDSASKVYVKTKTRTFERLGLPAENFIFPEEASTAEILSQIDRLNADPQWHGILVQLPLPPHIDAAQILQRIHPLKDVDGFHPENMGRLLVGYPRYIPCTPQGILEILDFYKIPVKGMHAVIVGRSDIVGKPMMVILARKWERGNATVTVCHTATPDIGYHTRQADLLVAASGIAGLITGDMIKPGAVVIDVGINRMPDETSEKGYRIVGDVVTEDAIQVARAVTPVPGGVGKMTVAMLVGNTVLAAENSRSNG